MSTGCKQYRVKQVGIAHCINISATVDTVFPITFTAFDSEGLIANVTRTITIVEPCAEGETWCPENSPEGGCQVVKIAIKNCWENRQMKRELDRLRHECRLNESELQQGVFKG